MPRTYLPGCVEWPAQDAERFCALGYWSGETFWEFLKRCAAAFGSRTALIDERRRLSYSALLSSSEAMARGFASRGIRAHDRVILQLSNRVEWFEACFGLFRLGAIPILV